MIKTRQRWLGSCNPQRRAGGMCAVSRERAGPVLKHPASPSFKAPPVPYISPLTCPKHVLPPSRHTPSPLRRSACHQCSNSPGLTVVHLCLIRPLVPHPRLAISPAGKNRDFQDHRVIGGVRQTLGGWDYRALWSGNGSSMSVSVCENRKSDGYE